MKGTKRNANKQDTKKCQDKKQDMNKQCGEIADADKSGKRTIKLYGEIRLSICTSVPGTEEQ